MSKKNSGAQNRKRKAKQEIDAAIHKDSLLQFLKKNIESEDGIARSTSQTSESHATMQESTSSTYVDTIVTGIHENISIATYAEGFAGVEMRLEAVVSPTETALENRDDHNF